MRKVSGRTQVLALGVVSAAYGLTQLFQPVVVVGESMSPTLPHGRVLFVDRTYYRSHRPAAGEVAMFTRNGEICIKRIYRGPGETVYCAYSGVGNDDAPRLISEPHFAAVRKRYSTRSGPLRLLRLQVPDDRVFVVGDNPNQSEDSRAYGCIPIRDLLGRVQVDPEPTLYSRWEMRVPPNPRLRPTHAQHKPPGRSK